ncbi:hypothetical protein F5051DRAFT_410822 [Lentinula edodes]|nr:hypothetical protein F5051DRAFT_410822 [Lentinula edodes]
MCLAMSFLLNHDAPYPADELWWGAEDSISRTLVMDPSFQLSAWYAQQRAERLGHLFDHEHHGIPAFPASPFPVITDPFQRFEISKKSTPISILRNTRFNLVGWWKKHLTKYLCEQEQRFEKARISHERKVAQANKRRIWNHQKQGEILALAIEEQLELAQPFPGDSELLEQRFSRFSTWTTLDGRIGVLDHIRQIKIHIQMNNAANPHFRPGELWNQVCARISGLPAFKDMDYQRLSFRKL